MKHKPKVISNNCDQIKLGSNWIPENRWVWKITRESTNNRVKNALCNLEVNYSGWSIVNNWLTSDSIDIAYGRSESDELWETDTASLGKWNIHYLLPKYGYYPHDSDINAALGRIRAYWSFWFEHVSDSLKSPHWFDHTSSLIIYSNPSDQIRALVKNNQEISLGNIIIYLVNAKKIKLETLYNMSWWVDYLWINELCMTLDTDSMHIVEEILKRHWHELENSQLQYIYNTVNSRIKQGFNLKQLKTIVAKQIAERLAFIYGKLNTGTSLSIRKDVLNKWADYAKIWKDNFLLDYFQKAGKDLIDSVSNEWKRWWTPIVKTVWISLLKERKSWH